ncbi:MAG: PAS domain-containing protein [Gemmatimonadetes bacterium]|nr:PAS domain-containing protein [Gemmatimonadota bacterium]
MSSTAPATPPAVIPTSIDSGFRTLVGIAARVAAAPTPEDAVMDVLALLRGGLHAEECGIWLVTPAGLIRTWGLGDLTIGVEDVEAAIDARGSAPAADGALIVRLTAGDHRVGALAVRTIRPLAPAEQDLVAGVANVLAPVLAHSEHSHQLEEEVAIRTTQVTDERRFTEKIIDSLPVGLYVIDRDFRIQAWNRKRETGMQGVNREEAIGRTIFEILHRQPAEMLRREFEEVFRTGRIQQFQMESFATGDLRTYRITKIPMRLSDAGVTHVITIGEDVTDWKEAEGRFSEAEKLAALGQLSAGVMHEINNPLATIAACAESLQLKLEDLESQGITLKGDYNELLTIVDNEVHRCKRIVDGLLDFSRPKPVTKELVHINQVVEKTLFLLKHHVRFKKVHVHTHLDPDLQTLVYASAEQLVQVFMALLLNALDAIGDSGTIIIRTRPGRSASEAVLAEVIDDGQGIPRGEQGKIFEPFYTTKAPGRGTGLGLSICYGIVSDHGGRIEVDSVPGKGSTFRVILPGSEGQ